MTRAYLYYDVIRCDSILDLWTPCATVHHLGRSGVFEVPLTPKLDPSLAVQISLPASDSATLGGRFYAIWPGSHRKPTFSTLSLTLQLFIFSAFFLHFWTHPHPMQGPVSSHDSLHTKKERNKIPRCGYRARGLLSPPHGTDELLRGTE